MNYWFSFLSLFFAATLLAGPLPEIPSGDIPRFVMVADGLYRGGQPSARGFELLKQRGFKTIINLRAEYDEAETVQKLGMKSVQIPIDEVRPWSQIPQAAIAKYFEIVNNPDNYPIFFHCQRGADRTGTMAAFYRIGVQGWDAGKAYAEARDIGMRWWYAGLKTQLYEFHSRGRANLQPAMAPRKN